MSEPGTDYPPEFYDLTAEGCRSSASVIVPLLMKASPTRVVDVGCGRGWWSAEFTAHGCDVLSIDGDWVDAVVPVDHRPLTDLPAGFDLAVCLEVAEHLPLDDAHELVTALTRAAAVVAFSAAIPGQSGPGHISCRWQSYWAALFAEHGFLPDDRIRRTIWTDQRVEPWYRQNLLVYSPTGEALGPLDVVHPGIWEWKC